MKPRYKPFQAEGEESTGVKIAVGAGFLVLLAVAGLVAWLYASRVQEAGNLDPVTFCPKDGASSVTSVLVDRTDGINEIQAEALEALFMTWIDKVPDHGAFRVYEVSSAGLQKPIVDVCNPGDVENVAHVLQPVLRLFGDVDGFAVHFDRAAAFGVVGPLRRVEQVRAPIRNHAAGIILNPAKVVMHAIRRVGLERRRAEPHLVIEFLGHGHRRVLHLRERTLRQDHFDALQLADATIAHEFGHAVILRHGTIFGARLKNFFVFADGFDQQFAFINRERRFLALHILARLNRHDADDRVPMVRRGNHHRINVFAREYLPEILRHETIFALVAIVDRLLRAEEMLFIHVARRDDLRILVPQIRPEIPADAMIPRADEADGDAVVRGNLATHAEDGTGDDLWSNCGGNGCGSKSLLEKTSSAKRRGDELASLVHNNSTRAKNV